MIKRQYIKTKKEDKTVVLFIIILRIYFFFHLKPETII